MKFVIIICYFSFTLFADSVVQNRVVGRYDFLLLAQMWPLTSYWNNEEKWTTTDCKLSPEACSFIEENQWLLQGFWPQRYSGKNPAKCTKDIPPYNASEVRDDLKSRLKQKILSYNPKLSNEDLWQLQWEKHGSCASDLDVFKNETIFLSKILDLFELYDMKKILLDAHIEPGKESYKLDTIIAPIRAKLDIEPIIKCAFKQHSDDTKQYLFKIHICLNKGLELQNCGPRHVHTCDREKEIYYPKWTASNNTERSQ